MKLVRTNRPNALDVFNPNVVNRFFSDVWNNFEEEFTPAMSNFKPGSEIVKNENGFEVKVSLPGVKKEDVKIELDGNVLSISGERKNEHTENKNNVLRSEISYGKFSRSFTLSADIDRTKIEANFEDGMLKMQLPVVEKALAQTIEIK
ncbi:MAG: Hsp20/alpha crystallin family protein [Bacteroidetes bacterium]|nr:Hsp20/alpha crystallin family protein [Bacteroidota bacterium]